MHGGNDPDNVAEGGPVVQSYLAKVAHKPARKHDGSIIPLVEGKDDVDLSSVALNQGQADELAQYLEENKNIQNICLHNCCLDDASFSNVSESIIVSKSQPKILNLNVNKLGPQSAVSVVDILRKKPSVDILLLHGNPLGDQGVQVLVDGLLELHADAKHYKREHKQHHDEEEDGTEAESPSGFCSLKELDLGNTNITDGGLGEVARLLESNTGLQTLNLNGNTDISLEGWRRLGRALRDNKTLQTLSLDFNRIGDNGIGMIAKGLKDNLTLKTLDVEDTGITEEGGRILLALLKVNTAILEITTSPGNSISEDLLLEIRNYIAMNKIEAAARLADGRTT